MQQRCEMGDFKKGNQWGSKIKIQTRVYCVVVELLSSNFK